MDSDDPPRKNYGFKDREFQRDNAPASAVPPMPTAQDLAKLAGNPVPTRRDATGPKADDPNDVYAVLERNRAVERRHGRDEVVLKKTTSRRKRDFWLLLVPGDLLFGTLIWQGRDNPFVLVYGLAGLVIFTLGVTWIMWFVMDDY